MKKFYIILASSLVLIASGVVANAETIAKSEPYNARVELPKTKKTDKPPILTSDYEEDETVVYKGK